MKLALFDVDGTLMDSQAMILASLTAAFTAEGLSLPSRSEMLGIVGLSLVKAIVADLEAGPGRGAASQELQAKFASTAPADVKAKCIEILRQASELLDAKAPGNSAAFRAWLARISREVAEAAKEGGFLGIGGVPVSEAERATLSEISSALRI